MSNAHRAWSHVRGDLPEQITFANKDVMAIDQRCRSCHRQEYARWESGPHSAGFARIFLDQEHNAENMLLDDCLRCHGMYFEGGIGDLQYPTARVAWPLGDAVFRAKALSDEYFIPGLAGFSRRGG